MAESRGTLHIRVQEARNGGNIEGASIMVSSEGAGIQTGISDAGGMATFSIRTPSEINSLTPTPRGNPYTVVNLRIVVSGYTTVNIIGEQIFPGQTTTQTVTMYSLADDPGRTERMIVIPGHSLYTNRTGSATETSTRSMRAVTTASDATVRRVVVPETLRVHLGPPGSNAETVTVPFLDYIKNVASSEIYPTWPENSLISNVIAQVSLALNRLYTEWYPSQGYNFDITNSTAYDQYYVHERGIFDTISTVVDGYFTNYLARQGHIEPLFAEYCDGSSVTCDGMSQWGTVSLARRNYTPLQILQYYYGDGVEIREAPTVESQAESFPGALQQGADSSAVRTLQNRLNRIAINFPSIPFILPENGEFDNQTALAVRAFQRLFRIEETGTVNRETWYRIQYIYTAVKKLAELSSEGEFSQTDTFNGRNLQVGDRGTEVLRIQQYLQYISDRLGSDSGPAPTVDGVFGDTTQRAVRSFQEYYGLIPTGTVNEATWNGIVTTYYALGGGEVVRDDFPYPGTPLRRGSRGNDVSSLQTMLNRVATVNVSMPLLAVDGIFGPQTEQAVRMFQEYYGLTVDGIAGPQTWKVLAQEYARLNV